MPYGIPRELRFSASAFFFFELGLCEKLAEKYSSLENAAGTRPGLSKL